MSTNARVFGVGCMSCSWSHKSHNDVCSKAYDAHDVAADIRYVVLDGFQTPLIKEYVPDIL